MLMKKPPSPAKYSPELPPEICKIVLKMLAKNPEQRYATYESLRQDLIEAREFCDTHTTSQEIIPSIASSKEDLRERPSSTPLQWTISISIVAACAILSYLYVIKPAFAKDSSENIIAESTKPGPIPKSAKDEIINEENIDTLVSSPPKIKLIISSLLPDPQGYDPGNEWVEIMNIGKGDVNLSKWTLKDKDGKTLTLSGFLVAGAKKRILLPENSISLNNQGDYLSLADNNGKTHYETSYTVNEVDADKAISPSKLVVSEKN